MIFELAVYGTLRKNQLNHDILRNFNYIGRGITVNEYTLLKYNNSAFLTERPTSNILVEIYEVSDSFLVALDYFYKKLVKVLSENNQYHYCWIYFYKGIEKGNIITSGDFTNEKN